jgi:hypothetical protein
MAIIEYCLYFCIFYGFTWQPFFQVLFLGLIGPWFYNNTSRKLKFCKYHLQIISSWKQHMQLKIAVVA